MSLHDYDAPQPLASRRGFPVDPLAKLPPKTRKRPQGSTRAKVRTLAIDWVKHLDEVGASMKSQAMNVDRLYADAAELLKQAQRAEETLLFDVGQLWKPREIAAAKRAHNPLKL